MNKERVDANIGKAYDVLKKRNIADEKDVIQKAYRGQISSFGAAVSSGSLVSAIAFFSDKGQSKVDREKLMDALYDLLSDKEKDKIAGNAKNKLFAYVRAKYEKGEIDTVKEEVLDCSIALKLAMNLYSLADQEEK